MTTLEKSTQDATLEAVVQALGHSPHNVSENKCGYDIESTDKHRAGNNRRLLLRERLEIRYFRGAKGDSNHLHDAKEPSSLQFIEAKLNELLVKGIEPC